MAVEARKLSGIGISIEDALANVEKLEQAPTTMVEIVDFISTPPSDVLGQNCWSHQECGLRMTGIYARKVTGYDKRQD